MREAHLRDFIAVIETGSVRAAAKRLNLTQGAISRNLTTLDPVPHQAGATAADNGGEHRGGGVS
jgi:hypothetical protein